MKIKMNCSCGALLDVEEDSYVQRVIEQADKWATLHKDCPSRMQPQRELFDAVTEHALRVYEQVSERGQA
jgi:hypothetical protein